MVKIYDILKERFMPSTSAGYMVKVKTFFNYAIDNNWMKINPFNGIKIDKGIPEVKYLSADDMENIKRLDLTDYERLERVRDLLLFQASVGTAYCDLVNFSVGTTKKFHMISPNPYIIIGTFWPKKEFEYPSLF